MLYSEDHAEPFLQKDVKHPQLGCKNHLRYFRILQILIFTQIIKILSIQDSSFYAACCVDLVVYIISNMKKLVNYREL